MSRGALQALPRLHVPIMPPALRDGSRAPQVGTTVTGLPIYEVDYLYTENVPQLDDDGKPRYSKNPTNGEPIVMRRKIINAGWRKKFVVPNEEGNGNLSWITYTPPTEEEIAKAKRQTKIEQMTPELSAALVDAGMTPAELLRLLSSQKVEPIEPPPPPASPPAQHPAPAGTEPPAAEGEKDGEEVSYPKALPGVARWELSNRTVFKGSRADAEEAQATIDREVVETKAAAAATPAF
jgi:hypothetical protein